MSPIRINEKTPTVSIILSRWARLRRRWQASKRRQEAAAALPDDEQPLRAELLTVDRMVARAQALAAEHVVVKKTPDRRMLTRLLSNQEQIKRAEALLESNLRSNIAITPSGEWLLDNRHVIDEQIQIIRRHLPPSYSKSLPILGNPDKEGLPRVFDLAEWIVSHGDARLDELTLSRVLAGYQEVTPLTLGELWAIPIMLRLALIENLRRISVRAQRDVLEQREAQYWAARINEAAGQSARAMVVTVAELASSDVKPSRTFVTDLTRRLHGVDAEAAPAITWIENWAREIGTSLDAMVAEEGRKQAADQVSVSNAIGSLRALAGIDWRRFVEANSAVEAVLLEDPSRTYPLMDFETRDQYRHRVEALAKQCRAKEVDVARHVVQLAQNAQPDTLENHVGWYLIDDGQKQLCSILNTGAATHARPLPTRSRKHMGLYLLPIIAMTLVAMGLAVRFWPNEFSSVSLWLVTLAAGIVASELAIVLTNWIATLTATPQRLPRLDFSLGIPESAQTLVVVPTMFGSTKEIDSLVNGLEVRYLGNQRGAIRFALLSDFPDADTADKETDNALLQYAHEAIAALNQQYVWNGRGDRFLLLHRPRLWNASEGKFIAYERKRGKLAALNALIGRGDGSAFIRIVGDIDGLENTKYVLTLDTDTLLPRNAAAEMAATIAHPLNRPVVNLQRNVVERGYGLLQPGLGSTMSGRGQSRFARLFGSETGIDPYTRTVSDVYQDLFGEGSFVGKGIYDVATFEQVLHERFPDNRILSHDLLEGNYIRAGLLSDVRVYEDYPARYAADIKRRARWIRGDWQLLPWLLPFVARGDKRRERNPMSWLAWGKMVDNLRRSLVPIATVFVLAMIWRFSAAPGWWTIALLGTWFLPSLLRATLDLVRVPASVAVETHWAAILSDLRTSLWRGVVQLSSVAYEAGVHLRAIALTLWRLLITKKNLLEWDASHQVESKLRKTKHPELRLMMASPIFAIAIAVWLLRVRPEVLPIAAPILLAWLAAPALLSWLGDVPPSKRDALNEEGFAFAQRLSRRTWAFFEDYVNAENNFLPPDNVQFEPVFRVAHRTSPTNIGLAILANLQAWDLGYIQFAEVIRNTARTVDTLEKMERYRGHFYNWYETTTLAPLLPHYISTVDSGNFAMYLHVAAQGIRELSLESGANAKTREGLHATLNILDEARTANAGASNDEWLDRVRDMVGDAPYSIVLEHARQWETAIELPAEEQRWRARFIMQLANAVEAESDSANPLELSALADRLEALAEIELKFLYDDRKDLLHIGFNRDNGQLDGSYYDLLASEARMTSFLGVATGQLPEDAWFSMGRLQTEIDGEGTLLSWSGSMFEYLMPDLVMPNYPDTLLDSAVHNAVRAQIQYGKTHNVPWGISESGYNAFDKELNYQYRAFGVPGLALKRGLGRDLVVAPYASVMAVMVEPNASIRNLTQMQSLGFLGEYGVHEAVDYTRDRLPRGQVFEIIRSYMAHHQGMGFLALGKILSGAPMQRRFADIPMFRSSLLLLQERSPRVGIFHPADETGEEVELLPALMETPLRVFKSAEQRATVQPLSNGRVHGVYTAAGGGSLRLGDIALTRWRDDPTSEGWGQFLYLRDVESSVWWSAAHLPSRAKVERHEAIFSDAKVEYRIANQGIESHMEIVVSPEDDAELRRINISNRSRTERTIEFTTFAEVALSRQAADEAHPAFGNLFVRTEYIGEKQAILCTRRPRSEDEHPPMLVHMVALHGGDLQQLSHETDRARFVGRTRSLANPLAMDPNISALSDTTGAVLDPAVALRGRITLQPNQTIVLDVVTAAAPDREGALFVMDKFRDRRLADRTFEMAWTHAQIVRRQLDISDGDAELFARIAGLVVQPQLGGRGDANFLAQNRSGQSALWPHSISGDLPIILLQLSSNDHLEMVRKMARAHAWLRAKGIAVDLVIVNQNLSTYRQELQDEIRSMLAMDPEGASLDRPGGIYVRSVEQLTADEQVLLQAVARVVLDDRRGSVEQQLARVAVESGSLRKIRPFTPRNAALLPPVAANDGLPPLDNSPQDFWPLERAPSELRFFNGLGGFSENGREYVIVSKPGEPTPMPWSNVLANEKLGCVVSESGTGYTWYGNAHSYRLTPWHNDPVIDPQGEAFFVRDEETGATWSPTPLPMRGTGSYRTRHGFGYTVFEHVEGEIATELWVFVDSEDAVKHSLLRIRNLSSQPRDLSVWGYVDWVLGDTPSRNRMHVVTEIEPSTGALVARNAYHSEFGTSVAFFDMDATINADGQRNWSFTSDREEFLGKNGSLRQPNALRMEQLSGRVGVGMDPCGALQRKVSVPPNATVEISFRLGAASSLHEAAELVRRTRATEAAFDALDRTRMYWLDVISAVQVQTPDQKLDLMVNGWLPYQIVASRVLARSGYYQSGGAYGFRDQLQDTMASVHALPALSREHLLRSAAHQFPEGDVLHWWHPPGEQGVRTRCSDDYLWLPHAAARYIQVTHDRSVLDEMVQYIEGRPVPPDQESYYDKPVPSSRRDSFFEHCKIALQRGVTLVGERGLPLMGTGDWNDGMNKVGEKGRGESVWLGFFLYDTLRQFAPIARDFGDSAFADECEQHAEELREAIERHAWDGEWYLRAWYDDGTPLGSHENDECRIDAISQAWSVISKAGSGDRTAQAMTSLEKHLVRRNPGLIQLLDPPFDEISHDPGYIRGYVPGVRENGGQYTHAAVWAVMAFARQGDRDLAWELAEMINPISRATDAESTALYKVEPYVLAADVYGVDPHQGRGGWTWYTGSAGWMYRMLLEDLLGVQRDGDVLRIDPMVPPDWNEYSVRYRHDDTLHEIRIAPESSTQPQVIALQSDGDLHAFELRGGT